MKRVLITARDYLCNASARVAEVCIMIISIIIVIEIVYRGLFGRSTFLSDELSGYLVVTVTFLGLAYVARHGGHISIDIMTRRLPAKIKAVVSKFSLLISLAITILLLIGAINMCVYAVEYGGNSTTPLAIPLWIPKLTIPIGLTLLCVELVFQLLSRTREKEC